MEKETQRGARHLSILRGGRLTVLLARYRGRNPIQARLEALKFPNSDRRRLNTFGVVKPNRTKKGRRKGMDDMTIHIETLSNLIEALKAEGLSEQAIVRVIEKMTKKSD